MFVLFLKQNFAGIHWMLQLRQFHSFWKEYKSISMTELLQCSNTESACACALSLFSWEMVGNFQCLHCGCFLTPMDTDHFGLQRGYINYPVMRYMAAQHCSNQDPLSWNTMDFHREFWWPESADNLLMISKGLMCKNEWTINSCDQLY